MRVLNFSDAFISESAPSQGAVTANAQKTFANDAAYVADKGSAAAKGDNYFNTTTNVQRHYDGTSWVNSSIDNLLNDLLSSKVADYTVLDNDLVRTVVMTTGATDKTVTLPTAADNEHRILTIIKKDTGAGDCIVDGEAAEQVGDAASYTMSLKGESVTVQSDGVGWPIISRYIPEVSAYYNDTKSSSISSGVSFWLDVTNKVYDTANNGTDLVTPGVGTWKFTAPRTGKYNIRGMFLLSQGTQLVAQDNALRLYKGIAAQQNIGGIHNQSSTDAAVTIQGDTQIALAKGDEIHLELIQSNGVSRTLINQARYQWIQVAMER